MSATTRCLLIHLRADLTSSVWVPAGSAIHLSYHLGEILEHSFLLIFSLFINVSKYTNKFYPPNGVFIHPFHPSILLHKIIHLIFFQLALLNPSLVPATAIFHLLLLPMFEATDKFHQRIMPPQVPKASFTWAGCMLEFLGQKPWDDLLTPFLRTQLQLLSHFPLRYWGNC